MSDVKPQKDCLWLKDNAFYMFGSNGWKKINDNTEVINKIENNVKKSFQDLAKSQESIEIPVVFNDIINEFIGGGTWEYEDNIFSKTTPKDGFYIKDETGVVLFVPRENRLDRVSYYTDAKVSSDGEIFHIGILDGKLMFITDK